MTTVRAATIDDLEPIVAMTRAQRRQLARWSPVYFRPRAGADEAHAAFLAFIVESHDHDTVVMDDDGDVFGFFVRIGQERHLWIDDLCVAGPERWPETIRLVVESSPAPWVTCVAAEDHRRRHELGAAGLREISTYYVKATAGIAPKAAAGGAVEAGHRGDAPAHTFGGRPFSADLPGALVVTDGRGGLAIGSPSASPPLYDPGGPTCVVDQVRGRDRARLVDDAVAAAAGRDDAQVVVVCGHDDPELAEVAHAAGFTPEVIVIGS